MNFLSKMFGGLERSYYIREFLFGLIFAIPLILLVNLYEDSLEIRAVMTIISIIFNFLYPYSSFVFQSVVNYIMGDTVFFSDSLTFFMKKFANIGLCWGLSWILAPIGLIYLYFYHTKQEKESVAE